MSLLSNSSTTRLCSVAILFFFLLISVAPTSILAACMIFVNLSFRLVITALWWFSSHNYYISNRPWQGTMCDVHPLKKFYSPVPGTLQETQTPNILSLAVFLLHIWYTLHIAKMSHSSLLYSTVFFSKKLKSSHNNKTIH